MIDDRLARCLLRFVVVLLLVTSWPNIAWPRDIKMQRLEYSASNIFWLDNYRILIATSKAPESEHGERTPITLILDTRNGRTEARPEVWRPKCYASGYFTYDKREGDIWIEYAGSFGEEREIKRWRKGDPVHEPRPYFNELDCREHPIESLPRVDGRFFYPLRPGDGYWGSVSDSHEQQLKSLLMRATGEVIEIPIPTPVVTAPKYSDYLGAYFYQRNYSSGPGIVDKVWTLKPTGETELLEMPTGPWARGGRYYWPVKNGWILISSALSIRPPHFPGDAGLYFISEGKAKRFVAGFPEPFAGAISPDGCRFVSPLQLRPGERPQLHLIDVCDSRR